MAAKVGIFEDTSLSTDIKTLSISKNLQASIVESITKTGNSKAFEAEMEEKYKDYLLNKEALGDMFDVVKNAVSIIRTQKNITLSSKYKDKVLANRSEKSNKVEKENTINNNKDIVKNQRFLPYTFNTSGELIEAKDSGQYGIVVFLKEGDNFEDAVLASNVSIVQSSANSNSSCSRRLSSSRANTSQSSGNTQNNSTSTSTY